MSGELDNPFKGCMAMERKGESRSLASNISAYVTVSVSLSDGCECLISPGLIQCSQERPLVKQWSKFWRITTLLIQCPFQKISEGVSISLRPLVVHRMERSQERNKDVDILHKCESTHSVERFRKTQ